MYRYSHHATETGLWHVQQPSLTAQKNKRQRQPVMPIHYTVTRDHAIRVCRLFFNFKLTVNHSD